MSDTPQDDGWWQASDGKWYPPNMHPDYVDKRPTPLERTRRVRSPREPLRNALTREDSHDETDSPAISARQSRRAPLAVLLLLSLSASGVAIWAIQERSSLRSELREAESTINEKELTIAEQQSGININNSLNERSALRIQELEDLLQEGAEHVATLFEDLDARASDDMDLYNALVECSNSKGDVIGAWADYALNGGTSSSSWEFYSEEISREQDELVERCDTAHEAQRIHESKYPGTFPDS